MANKTKTTPAQRIQAMKDRVAAGLDPLTGKPWTLCAWSTVLGERNPSGGYAHCGGCGMSVKLDADGGWVYEAA